jgi:hypothetical protein
MDDMRKAGLVVFTNEQDNGEDFVLVWTLEELEYYVDAAGWESVEQFEKETGYSRNQMIGASFCYVGSRLWLVKDEPWYNSIDKPRLQAVFNKYVLDPKKLTVKEAGDIIINSFSRICGAEISLNIKEIVDRKVMEINDREVKHPIEKLTNDREVKHPTEKLTTELIERVMYQMLNEFYIEILHID